MNETQATVIRKLGEPFYSVVIMDSEYNKVLETLGSFENPFDAESFADLWNRMYSIDDLRKNCETCNIEEE